MKSRSPYSLHDKEKVAGLITLLGVSPNKINNLYAKRFLKRDLFCRVPNPKITK